jgi:chromosome partitioning protein
MIVACGGIKGGVGKTTIAVHLAVLAMAAGDGDVLLIDADSQGSASDFTALRREARGGESGYTSVQLAGSAVRSEGLRLASKFETLFIDVGGRDSAAQRAALALAQVVILPFLPSSLDIWSLERTADMLQEARAYNENLRALAILNRADPLGSDNLTAMDVAREIEGLKILQTRIGNRKAFRNATGQGLAVTEIKPRDKKAVTEITDLFTEIMAESTS